MSKLDILLENFGAMADVSEGRYGGKGQSGALLLKLIQNIQYEKSTKDISKILRNIEDMSDRIGDPSKKLLSAAQEASDHASERAKADKLLWKSLLRLSQTMKDEHE